VVSYHLTTKCAIVCLGSVVLCRVSIQHVNFHQPFRLKTGSEHLSPEETKAEAPGSQENDGIKVYPISSEWGYVIYHVASSLLMQTPEDLDGLTSGAGNCIHDETMIKNSIVEQPSSLDFPAIDIFTSQAGSLDRNGQTAILSTFSNVGRDSDDGMPSQVFVEETCGNDDNDSSSSIESVVEKIIDDIIDSVVTVRCLNSDDVDKLAGDVILGSSQPLANGVDGEEEAPGTVGNVQSPSDVGGVVQTHSPMMHPLYAHILLYVRKFDTHRALYALERLRGILSTSPNVIVRALTTSNVGGKQLKQTKNDALLNSF